MPPRSTQNDDAEPARPTHLAIRDWADHQHYRDRRPPWIKLHRSILTNATFLALPEAAQAQLVKLWVLASQMGHPLPYNARLLQGQIGSTGRFHLETIIAAGLMVPCYQDASKPLADSKQNARPLRTEREGERKKTTTSAAAKTPRDSWLLPSSRVWEARFGDGTFPWGEAGKFLKPLHRAGHEPPTIAEHFGRYLAKTDTQYVSVSRFAKTFADYKAIQASELVDEFGVLTALGEKETRPLKIA